MKTKRRLLYYLLSACVFKRLGIALCLCIPLLSPAATNEAKTGEQKSPVEPVLSQTTSQTNQENNKDLANQPEGRGKLLYENHCQSCHQSMVHVRAASKAKSFEDVQYWVGRWSTELKVKWSADEIDDVVRYLNQTFYHYTE